MWSGKFNDEIEETFMPTYRQNRVQTDAEMLAELAKVSGFKKASD